ncbi:hypothetical protein, partial [Nocardia brasiliensis]|uniref:hypothetical protein n=1 Tax=Nocardia brasiliensis TaxID=37326 RepID=UPI0024581AED
PRGPAYARPPWVAKKPRFLEPAPTPRRCPPCQSQVLVRKSSAHQTSVQWTEPPQTHCPVFAELSKNGAQPGRPDTCAQLEKTIKWAVDEGVLEVPE